MTLHRKPIEVDGAWLLTEHDDKTAQEWIFAAISALTPLGYRATPLAGESGVIDRVEIGNSDPTGAKQASVGQWIVLDDGVLKVLTTEECDAMYEEVD
jgi:hypothetical protein